jgi:hypothetical protein
VSARQRRQSPERSHGPRSTRALCSPFSPLAADLRRPNGGGGPFGQTGQTGPFLLDALGRDWKSRGYDLLEGLLRTEISGFWT